MIGSGDRASAAAQRRAVAPVSSIRPTTSTAPQRRAVAPVSSIRPTTSTAPRVPGVTVASTTVAPTTVGTAAPTTGGPTTEGPTTEGPTTVPPPDDPPVTFPPPTYPPVTVKRTTPARGPIVDPWRPPSTPYGPGNRGIDIGTVPGALVVSPADGLVSFAGTVGFARFVVVESSDGIRITVGFLAAVTVRTGQVVRRGQAIGRAGLAVHIGARIGEDYLDPTPLFSGGPPHIRLVAVV